MKKCSKCGLKPFIKRPKNDDILCKECFFSVFEEEIHFTIKEGKLINPGDKIAIGASGGKDSTVLAYTLKLLNERYNYGAELILLSIDEGIQGYRDDSLETVKRNQIQYSLPLEILSYKDLYGWTMDEIVNEIGTKSNCTYCGILRRQALDRGAYKLGVDKICTGHNADDTAETILMNILRGDIGRLQRCSATIVCEENSLPRFKPFKYTYEKEIVMYAFAKNLDYFSTECKYAPYAYRGHVRSLVKRLEKMKPLSLIDIIISGETFAAKQTTKLPQRKFCDRCGFLSSHGICQACALLEGLNKGLPRLKIID